MSTYKDTLMKHFIDFVDLLVYLAYKCERVSGENIFGTCCVATFFGPFHLLCAQLVLKDTPLEFPLIAVVGAFFFTIYIVTERYKIAILKYSRNKHLKKVSVMLAIWLVFAIVYISLGLLILSYKSSCRVEY